MDLPIRIVLVVLMVLVALSTWRRKDVLHAVDKFKELQAARDNRRNLQRTLEHRKAAKLKPFIVEDLKGQSIWVDAACWSDQLSRALARADLHVVSSRVEADVLLVANPTEPGERVLWAAIFRGGHVTAPAVFLKGHGPAITYAAMFSKKKSIYVTAKFKEKHAVLYTIAHASITEKRPGRRLVLVSEEDAFLDLKVKAEAKKRGAEVIGVGTQDEVANGRCGGHLRSKTNFTEWARHLNVTAVGQCSWGG